MSQYHCPYCSPRYQFHQQRPDGVMICGQCGDPLVRKSYIKPTQIFALIAATAFIAPFIFMVFSSLQDLNRPRPSRSNEPIATSIDITRFDH
tara:strand:- start:2269 stop:2544 length:276 start_codon:yes stop_codon:yes gene_type:complete